LSETSSSSRSELIQSRARLKYVSRKLAKYLKYNSRAKWKMNHHFSKLWNIDPNRSAQNSQFRLIQPGFISLFSPKTMDFSPVWNRDWGHFSPIWDAVRRQTGETFPRNRWNFIPFEEISPIWDETWGNISPVPEPKNKTLDPSLFNHQTLFRPNWIELNGNVVAFCIESSYNLCELIVPSPHFKLGIKPWILVTN